MKKLKVLELHKARELSNQELKAIVGGGPIEDDQKFCFVDGECVWVKCKTDADCPNYWDKPPYCR